VKEQHHSHGRSKRRQDVVRLIESVAGCKYVVTRQCRSLGVKEQHHSHGCSKRRQDGPDQARRRLQVRRHSSVPQPHLLGRQDNGDCHLGRRGANVCPRSHRLQLDPRSVATPPRPAPASFVVQGEMKM
jgi:hypothetical protein